MNEKAVQHGVSLDVVNLNYNMGKHFIKEVADFIKIKTPDSLKSIAPDIKAYVWIH
jgi:hypothetical protein